MGNSNGRISAPVSLHGDVYPVLGVSKTGTYYDTGYICSNAHGKINPFAKYKPTRYDNPNGGTNWWKASDGRYGFSVAEDTWGTTVEPDAWTYLPPRPGTDWCRLADFNGYDHYANSTLVTVNMPDKYVINNPLKFTLNLNNIGSAYALSVADVLNIDSTNYGGFHISGTYGTRTISQDVDWDGVTPQVNVELDPLGEASVGQYIRLAVSGKDSTGRIKSLRYSTAFKTRFSIPVASTAAYRSFINVQAVIRYMSNEAYIHVMNAKAVFTADGYSGGDIPEGGFGVWRQVYEQTMDVASASAYVRIPAQRISSGQTLNFALDPEVTIYSPVNETRVHFLIMENNAEKVRLTEQIRRMN